MNVRLYSIIRSQRMCFVQVNKSQQQNGINNQDIYNQKIQFNKKYSALFTLTNRAIISISGQDSTTFLQSMISNDMKLFDNDILRASIYGLFLSPKGRVLFDAIIIKSQL